MRNDTYNRAGCGLTRPTLRHCWQAFYRLYRMAKRTCGNNHFFMDYEGEAKSALGLWWPCVEQPDCWEEMDDGRWKATGWWGASVCEVCDLLMVEQPDGTPECYSLSH